MSHSVMHLIVASFVLLIFHLIIHPSHVSANTMIPVDPSCPIVPYTASVIPIGPSSSPPHVSLYRINYDIINPNPDVIIDYIDIHITSLYGFFNYRMKTTDHIQYTIILPNTLIGTSFQYWFTTASHSSTYPNIYACDSILTTFTAPSSPGTTNPTTSPPIVRTPGAICPALLFTHSLDATGPNSYTITFTPASDSHFVEWVDVHILANGRFLNYRMTMTEMRFTHTLPLPLLELLPGTSIVYWFTYSIPNDFANTGILPTRCDTSTYHVVINGSPSICPLLTFTHDVIFSTQYGSQRVNWNVTGSLLNSSIRATTVFVHITHASGDYTYQMFISPQDPAQQSYYSILPQILSQHNDTWTYSFTYNTDSLQTCATDTFIANV